MSLKNTILNTINTFSLKSTMMLVFLLSTTLVFSQDAANGEKLFKSNACSGCHSLGDNTVVGPGLKGLKDRWAGNEDMLYQWIQDPSKALATGDAYVSSIVKKYKPKGGMMAAQALSKGEIDDILSYIDSYVAPAPKEVVVEDRSLGSYWWFILGTIFIVVLWMLSVVKKEVALAHSKITGNELENLSSRQMATRWFSEHRTLGSLIGIFITVFLSVQLWYAAADIGIYTGYMPEQPIKYSHKLHAGDLKIDCQYCHSMAETSKTPMVPSMNVCMNCHKYVAEGPTTGKEEIAKIYDAIGWDPETFKYSGEEKPVKWIKVHDLPDHVYFNHSQHVKVGEIECQQCHGPIEEMEVVKQYSPLTMEWCIDCHTETEVSMKGNGYYDEIHSRLENNEQGVKLLKEYLEDGKITVKELGGWECSKCHY